MIAKLHSQRLQSLDEIRAFLSGTTPLDCEASNRTDASGWIEASLRQLRSLQLGTADTGTVTQYLEKVSGFSRAQVTRLSAQYRTTGSLRDHRGTPAKAFERYDWPVSRSILPGEGADDRAVVRWFVHGSELIVDENVPVSGDKR